VEGDGHVRRIFCDAAEDLKLAGAAAGIPTLGYVDDAELAANIRRCLNQQLLPALHLHRIKFIDLENFRIQTLRITITIYLLFFFITLLFLSFTETIYPLVLNRQQREPYHLRWHVGHILLPGWFNSFSFFIASALAAATFLFCFVVDLDD
jgi:hypothetical protein